MPIFKRLKIIETGSKADTEQFLVRAAYFFFVCLFFHDRTNVAFKNI